MSNTVKIVRHYSSEIRNGRTPMHAFDHLMGEVEELRVELVNGNTGPDGVKGETMDVVNCALDVLFQVHPDIQMSEIDAIMESKCRKWMVKYSGADGDAVTEGADAIMDILVKFKECDVSDNVVGQIAACHPASVPLMRKGSLGSLRTQKRLRDSFPVLNDAFEGYFWGVVQFWRCKDSQGRTLQELLSAEAVDLDAVRAYLAEHKSDVRAFKMGYHEYHRANA